MSTPTTTQLKQRLRLVARREREVAAIEGLAKVLIALAVFSAAFFLVDWLFLLPVAARILLLAGGFGAAAWIVKTDLYDPLRRRHDEISTALEIEQRFPELRDRLISVVQLSEAGEEISPALLERLEQETARMTAPLNFSDVIDWGFLRKILLIAFLIVATGFASAVLFPRYVMTTYRRMFLGDARYPSLTRIEIKDPKLRIVQGEDWALQVGLAGKIPSSVTLKMRTVTPPRPADQPAAKDDSKTAAEGKGKWSTTPLKPIIGYTYGVVLEKIQESFEFQVFAGDAWTDPMKVRVMVPVAVLDPLLDIAPPAYSGIKPVTSVSMVGASVLEGSTVILKVPTSKPVVSGSILLLDGRTSIPLAPSGHEPGGKGTMVIPYSSDAVGPNTTGVLVKAGSVNFAIRVRDADGLENTEPRAIYSLRVQKDQEPKASILTPKEDRLSVPYAAWKITYEATDDFGLRKAWLAWEAFPPATGGAASSEGSDSSSSIKPLRGGKIELQGEYDALRWSGEAILDMVAAKAAPGETLNAWIEAADARPGAAQGRSQTLRFKIVDETEKWAEIQSRLQAVEEGVIHLQDRQENVKKEVETLKK